MPEEEAQSVPGRDVNIYNAYPIAVLRIIINGRITVLVAVYIRTCQCSNPLQFLITLRWRYTKIILIKCALRFCKSQVNMQFKPVDSEYLL